MDNYELKPCPFCGGEAKLKHGFPGQQRQGVRQATVQCKTCGCRTVTYRQFPYEPWKNVDEYAIFVWNKRTAEDALSNPPLTLDELRELEGEPVWCENYQCWGIVKVESKGPWANQPFLCGAYHSDGFATNFEYDIEKRKLTLYRRRPEEYNKEAHRE